MDRHGDVSANAMFTSPEKSILAKNVEALVGISIGKYKHQGGLLKIPGLCFRPFLSKGIIYVLQIYNNIAG